MKKSIRAKRILNQAYASNPEARAQADLFVSEAPDDWEAWRTRAYVSEHFGDRRAAASDATELVRLRPAEPDSWFHRGRLRASIGDYQGAAEDCGAGRRICEAEEDDYYLESLLFVEAFSLVMMGELGRAAMLLERLPHGFQLWIDRLRSKEELQSQCQLRR